MTPALMARGLTVRLRTDAGTVHAASDVDLTLHRGSVHALVGESGCGKSVVAAALCGLLPRAATVSGTVVLGDDAAGVSLVGASEKTLRGVRGHRIALVPQSAATFLTPVRTVGSQLRETCRHLGAGRAPGDLLTTVGLDIGVAALYPHELSGGMAQRVAVAFALAGDPEVIVADEPTSSLDTELTDRILGLLGRCAADGAAVLLITHDIEALAGRADRISVMYASRIMEVGPCADVLGDPWHPYTADLLAALPSGGLIPLPGMPPELTDLDDECVYHLRTSAAAGFSGGPTTLVEDPPGRFVRRLVSR